jgi:hypothetical protein
MKKEEVKSIFRKSVQSMAPRQKIDESEKVESVPSFTVKFKEVYGIYDKLTKMRGGGFDIWSNALNSLGPAEVNAAEKFLRKLKMAVDNAQR